MALFTANAVYYLSVFPYSAAFALPPTSHFACAASSRKSQRRLGTTVAGDDCTQVGLLQAVT